MEDWYRVSQKDFAENGGSYLLSKFGGSPINQIVTKYLYWIIHGKCGDLVKFHMDIGLFLLKIKENF